MRRFFGGTLLFMTAYVLSEVEISDEALAAKYREIAAKSIAKYGGKYLVRAKLPDAVEGEWATDRRLVIVEFPSMQRVRQWYASPEYAPAVEIRRTALDRRLIFVDGGSD